MHHEISKCRLKRLTPKRIFFQRKSSSKKINFLLEHTKSCSFICNHVSLYTYYVPPSSFPHWGINKQTFYSKQNLVYPYTKTRALFFPPSQVDPFYIIEATCLAHYVKRNGMTINFIFLWLDENHKIAAHFQVFS